VVWHIVLFVVEIELVVVVEIVVVLVVTDSGRPHARVGGLTKEEAKKEGLSYGKGVFPWAANGRSLSLGRTEGKTKLLFDVYHQQQRRK